MDLSKGRNRNFRGKNWHVVSGEGPVVSGDGRDKGKDVLYMDKRT